jgi:hypothetical protein
MHGAKADFWASLREIVPSQYFFLGCFQGYKLSHAFILLKLLCVRVGIALDVIDLFDNNTWLRVYGSLFPFPPISHVPSITPARLLLYVSFSPSAKHFGMLSS